MLISKTLRTLIYAVLLIACSDSTTSDSSNQVIGQGGSLTRFAINGNYLYVVDHNAIQVFNTQNNIFEKVNNIDVNSGLETIFVKGDYLYLGARDAMFIYDISTPQSPNFIFRYSHITSCDPVVVQGNRAYVTLRAGTSCNLGTNALEILDISNPNNPTLIANYPMTSPYGLGVDGNLLFICEGSTGLKVYDITDERHIQLRKEVTDIFAYDVIPNNGVLTLTGEDGIFQYRYNNQGAVTLMSSIPVKRAEI
ncbi:MAG TPA: hypothetical protein PLJ60_06245 [Chryseolinea sp.]|nr:hypothetical protein [Chryseolinea sp.]HPH47179.1 hypothetical protein [Chryseolinea sp.]HPM29918.1 hypothetical protein [Chryseolinea sp.]